MGKMDGWMGFLMLFDIYNFFFFYLHFKKVVAVFYKHYIYKHFISFFSFKGLNQQLQFIVIKKKKKKSMLGHN